MASICFASKHERKSFGVQIINVGVLPLHEEVFFFFTFKGHFQMLKQVNKQLQTLKKVMELIFLDVQAT